MEIDIYYNGFTFTTFCYLLCGFMIFDFFMSLTFFKKMPPKDILTDEQKILIAWHEAGHTLAVKHFNFDLIQTNLKIEQKMDSLNLGMTMIKNDKVLKSKEDIENMIKIYYSGRIGELIYLDRDDSKLTSSCYDDISSSTYLLERYVNEYGYSDKYKLFSLKCLDMNNSQELIHHYLELSDKFYKEIENYLFNHKICIEMIANELLEKKTLSNQEIETIISKYEEENAIKI